MKPRHITPEQQRLIDRLLAEVKAHYPEISFKEYELNPDDKEHIWVVVNAPMDEEREIELGRFAAGISADILMEYDQSISVMTENPLSRLLAA
ncbi:MAG: hypothetical protein MUF71_20905 [Candidatus Kapabacteria bacterium]|jgi:hypothetical protein|nr:hypothetical protein [Candidatus Kapabacteria bacterium]